MVKEIANRVISKMSDVTLKYHRLVFLVGEAGSGKTRVLKEVERLTGAPRVNVSLELSKRLLGLAQDERSLRAPEAFREMLSELRREDGSPLGSVLLDDIEALFEPSFGINVVNLLQEASRNMTLVAVLTASIEGGFLTLSRPGYEKHGKYPTKDLVIVTLAS